MSENSPRSVLTSAIKRGLIIKQPCAVCGAISVQGHHADYRKPLEVTWLCLKHHRAEHKRLKSCGIVIPGRELNERIIRLRVSHQTYKKIAAAAMDAHRTLSNYVRLTLEAAIGKTPKEPKC